MDPQSELLSFLGSQLISHAATLFAIMIGLFTFMQSLRDHPFQSKRSIGVSMAIVEALMWGLVYVAFRTLFYGQFVDMILKTDPTANESMSSYYSRVSSDLRDHLTTGPLLFKIVSLFLGSYRDWAPYMFVLIMSLVLTLILFVTVLWPWREKIVPLLEK